VGSRLSAAAGGSSRRLRSVLAVAALIGVTLAEVATMAAAKRADRGAFTERIWIDGLEP
jgi:hypothetical protein